MLYTKGYFRMKRNIGLILDEKIIRNVGLNFKKVIKKIRKRVVDF